MTRPLFSFFPSLILLVVLAFFFSGKAIAQQSRQPDNEFVAPRKAKRTIEKKVDKEPSVEWNGSVAKAIQTKQPWQMVSPFAPDSYGNGEKMVSEDPDELGHPQGLVLFGIQW